MTPDPSLTPPSSLPLLANAFLPLIAGILLWERAPRQLALAVTLGLGGFLLGAAGGLYGHPWWCWGGADVFALLAVARYVRHAKPVHPAYPWALLLVTLTLVVCS